MSTKKESRNILDELETLQQVLDDAAGEQVDLERALTQLNTVDDIPVLSDLHTGNADASPLKPVFGRKPAAVSSLRPVQMDNSHPLDLRPQQRQLSPSEALDALHKQIDALPEADHSGEDWFQKNQAAAPDIPFLNPEPTSEEMSAALGDLLDEIDAAEIGFSETAPSKTASSKTDSTTAEQTEHEPIQTTIDDTVAEETASSLQAKPADTATDLNAPNPFLPQSVIDRLTHERLAAQHSAEAAHRTMQRATQRMDQRNADAAASLSDQARDKLIEELIQEMIPHIQARLRERLRQILKPTNNADD